MIEVPDELMPPGGIHLAELTEGDWELIQHLGELAGEAGRESGDLNCWGCCTADRARQLLEMPTDAIFSVVAHLAVLRRDALVEAIADVDEVLEGRAICRELATRGLGGIAAELHYEALQTAERRNRATTAAALRRWPEAQERGINWRDHFRLVSDLTGQQAAQRIAAKTDATVADVVLHARELQKNDQLQREQIVMAYTDHNDLLRDAVEAKAWEWLGAMLHVSPELLELRYVELFNEGSSGS